MFRQHEVGEVGKHPLVLQCQIDDPQKLPLASPPTTLWLQLEPRSDRVGTAGRSGNSVNAVNDRIGVRRKLVTALAQYQSPDGFLVPPVFLLPVLSGNHKFAVRLKNDVG